MEEKDLNFNYSECIKNYDTWGTTHYVNVCNGEIQKDIPWGVSEWGVFIFIVSLIVFMAAAVGIFIYEAIYY
jgi:hypothetical protein